jgi:hypothetical protein
MKKILISFLFFSISMIQAQVVDVGWANLQWPPNASIEEGNSVTVYAQIWTDGVTNNAGAGAGISAWIGYSSADTDPSGWTNWLPAAYNTDVGNNDEYQADVGAGLTPGTYYYASRFQINGGSFYYGGYNAGGGGAWDGATNVSGVLTVNAAALTPPTTPSLTSPADLSTGVSTSTALEWSSSATATKYHVQVSTNSSFTAVVSEDSSLNQTIFSPSGLSNSTTYYWHVRAGNAAGWSSWSASRSFTTEDLQIGWVNLQWPENAQINQGETVTVYAQAWIDGVTIDPGATTGLSAWIGYNNSDTDPSTWTNWIPATFNNDVGNNDEFQSDVGNGLNPGTYYYASRFQYNGGNFNYGGFSASNGGPWDGTNNVSGVLTVSAVLPDTPTLLSPADNSTNVSTDVTLEWNSADNADSYTIQVSTDANFNTIVEADSGITTLTKLINGLNNGTEYFWRVRGKNVNGNSAWSNTFSFTTVALVVNAPILLLPANGAVDQPTTLSLVWNDIAPSPAKNLNINQLQINADNFHLQVSTQNDFSSLVENDSTLTDSSKQLTNLQNNSKYYWRVRAKQNGTWSSWSTIWNFTTLPNLPFTPVLSSPGNGAVDQSTSLVLNWNQAQHASNYLVQVSTDQSFNTIVVDDSSTTTSLLITSLNTNTTYHWRVRSKNSAGLSAWSFVWSFTTQTNIPDFPVLLSPADNSIDTETQVNLAWSNVPAADNYRLQVSTDVNFNNLITDVATITSENFNISSLVYNTTYYWRVLAISGGVSSNWSSVWNFTTKTAPANLIASLNYISGNVGDTVIVDLNVQNFVNIGAITLKINYDSNVFSWGSTDNWHASLNSALIGASNGVITIAWSEVNGISILDDTLVRLKLLYNGGGPISFQFDQAQSEIADVNATALNVTFNDLLVSSPIDWVNLQWPPNANINEGESTTVYAQIYTDGVTNLPGQGLGVEAWIGFSSDDTDPSTWTNWVQASYNTDQGNNDEYQADIGGTLNVGTYYFASRFQLDGGAFAYGGYNIGGGGFWDGTTNVSGVLTVNSLSLLAPVLISPDSGSVNNNSSITLSWNASNGASSYEVEVSDDENFSNIIFSNSGVQNTSQQVNGLAINTLYFWRVKAVDGQTVSPWSNVWRFETGSGTNTIPQLVNPLNNSIDQSTNLFLRWSNTQGSVSYKLQVSTSSNFDTTILDVDTGTDTLYQLTGLSLSTTYYWRVMAEYAGGSSDWSAPWSFSTQAISPEIPALLNPLNNSTDLSTQVSLSWSATANANSYRLQVAVDDSFTNLVCG